MTDQKANLGKGFVFIPPPTAGQIAAPLAQAGPRSLKKTLLGLPAVAPPAHKPDADSAALWASVGLATKKMENNKEEAPTEEEVFDRLMELRRRTSPDNVKMATFIILQMEEGFRSLIASERLQPICSDGQAFLDAEKPVAESIGKIRDEVFRRFGEDRRLAPFLRDFVDTVLSSAPVSEREGETEAEMRNGFYRAVAWCICAHNDQEQFFSYIMKNNIALIDGVGIAAGLCTADSISPSFSRDIIDILLEKRWVSLAFYHLQNMIMAGLARLDSIERKGNGKDGPGGREGVLNDIYAGMDTYLMILFREVEKYQVLAQKYTHLAMLISNLSEGRANEVPLMYIAPSEFYSLIISRRMPTTKAWEDLGRTHKFIAEKMAEKGKGDGKRSYAAGFRPKDIAQRFFTILEAVDFLTGDKRVNDLALKLARDLYAPFLRCGSSDEAFKKIVTIALFTEKDDLQRHAALFSCLEDSNDPIISLRAAEHREMLLRKRETEAQDSADPFANIGDDDRF